MYTINGSAAMKSLALCVAFSSPEFSLFSRCHSAPIETNKTVNKVTENSHGTELFVLRRVSDYYYT